MKNLNKTTKTILFASLLAAMILPFSVMSMADAAPNENANDKACNELLDKIAKETEARKKELGENYTPHPSTDEELEQSRIQNKALNDCGIQTVGVGNEVGTEGAPPPPVVLDDSGNITNLKPEPGGSTDNYFGNNLNKDVSNINGVYAKSEVHDNGYTLEDGTTLYAPTLQSPNSGALEIVTAYYNPTGTTYDTLDVLWIFDHSTHSWVYSKTINSSFMSTYTSGGFYAAEVVDQSGTWQADIWNYSTASWDTLYTQSNDGHHSNGWYIWEEDKFLNNCPTVDPEIVGDDLQVRHSGTWKTVTSTYSNTYDTGLDCGFSGTWNNNYYKWSVDD